MLITCVIFFFILLPVTLSQSQEKVKQSDRKKFTLEVLAAVQRCAVVKVLCFHKNFKCIWRKVNATTHVYLLAAHAFAHLWFLYILLLL